MNVLFEEEGAFKAGSILADNVSTLQIETSSGKRVKVKSTSVLLRFAQPAPNELLEQAATEAAGMEAEFLWETCGDSEFAFEEFAQEYFGHPPSPIEAAAVLLCLHAAPIHFHRKGKGRFRKAPPEILKAALAGQEKKRLLALTIERMTNELKAGQLPAEFPPILESLLYKPDRNRNETKALEQACEETGQTALHLLAKCGAIPSTHDYHFNRFLFDQFPQGIAFGEFEAAENGANPANAVIDINALPLANVAAFSIDDAATTEIDDAFSVTDLTESEGGGWRIGIHIAAPGIGIQPGSQLDAIARSRLSTVYMPGRKITMLPDEVVNRFTLLAGRTCPALSLYLDIASDFSLRGTSSRIELVPIAANLRHHDIEPVFNEQTLENNAVPDFPYKRELTLLWELATVLEAGRGKMFVGQGSVEYGFNVDWTEPEGRVELVPRLRGSPLDTLVAELMIAANSTWGKLLADNNVAAIYRAQAAGKVRMTTAALPHEGLGVDCYAWASSPLRRYVDLLNQWQLISHLSGQEALFTARSEALLSAMRDFELTYATYAEFQRGMERYWCLRWLLQENLVGENASPIVATVVKESLVRLESAPLFLRCPSLPACDPRTRVRVRVGEVDLLGLETTCRYVETLAGAPAISQVGAEDMGEVNTEEMTEETALPKAAIDPVIDPASEATRTPSITAGDGRAIPE